MATSSSPGTPIYVQTQELADARTQDDYTIREWVEAPGVEYVPIGGELDEPSTEGQRLIRALDPEAVWLSHEHEPWRSPIERQGEAGPAGMKRLPSAD